MLRALYSGISGLQNHQVRMDTIGNNIANVNTTGYKSQRVTFSESFAQTLAGARRPGDGSGGTNPEQIGLGMQVGSVDTLLSQGDVTRTGQITDLAIEGSSYFAVSNGQGNFYTRNGSFRLDSDGNMVLPTNGYILQGRVADSAGNFQPGVQNIRIPFDQQAVAKSTETVSFARNLNSDSDAKGTIVNTQAYYHRGLQTESMSAMRNSQGQSLNLKDGDKITISASGAADKQLTFVSDPLKVVVGTSFHTYAQLTSAMDNFVNGNFGATIAASATKPGALELTPGGSDIRGLQISSDNPLSNSYLKTALIFPSNIANNSAAVTTDQLLSPAAATDFLDDVYDSTGRTLGLKNGDNITINANVGNVAITNSRSITYVSNTPATPTATTMQNLLDLIQDQLKLPPKDGSLQPQDSVSINAGDTNDNLTDGAIVVRGQKGLDFAITGLSIQASDFTQVDGAPSNFNANNSIVTTQKARDVGVYDTSITVYDDSGATHVLTMKFINSGRPGEWNWEVSVGGQEDLQSGYQGKLIFGTDGSVSSFTANDQSPSLTFDPRNGAKVMNIKLDMGGPGNFQGITQFEADSTVSAIKQDGYGTGKLSQITINEEGYVKGVFTNGTNKDLAQILLVDFANPAGLNQLSDSVFQVSANSGDPVFAQPGTQTASKIAPSALEGSNVDLSKEFTDMITTQRGYQANSRIITVSDSMLEELLSLKR